MRNELYPDYAGSEICESVVIPTESANANTTSQSSTSSAQGNLLQDYFKKFAELSEDQKLSKLCKDVSFLKKSEAAVLRASSCASVMSSSEPLWRLAAQLSSLATLEDSVAHVVQALLEAPQEPVVPIPARGPAPRSALLCLRSRSRSQPLPAVLAAPSCSASAVPRGYPSRAAPWPRLTARSLHCILESLYSVVNSEQYQQCREKKSIKIDQSRVIRS